MRTTVTLVAAAAAAAPSAAAAQDWSIQVGGTARAEYTDNYFFVPTDPQSAFTASIGPFVTAARKTETSEVTALLAVGANRVWGPSPTTDYFSGRFGLNGSRRDARATWSGDVALARAPSLQSQVTPLGVVLARAYVDSATANGAFTYALTEGWSLGAMARGYGNHYDGVQAGDTFQSNRGFAIGGTADYKYSDRTRLTLDAVYSYFASDIDRNDSVTAALGVVHKFSAQLTMSASVGGYRTNSEGSQLSGDQRRDTGPLFGGSIIYDLDERTRVIASLTETLAPSGTGVLTKSDNAFASVSHAFSDRFTGRLAAGYTRTVFPAPLGGSVDNDNYLGELGASYRFAERWTLDAGYRYARARYAQGVGDPKSHFVFVSVGYNWPGASITDWIGSRQDVQGLPGAGPVSLPDVSTGTPSPPAALPPASMERSPFDQYSIP